MSLFAHLQAQFAQAQAALAGAAGALPSDGKNVLINGARYVGVFGSPDPREDMNAGGGHRKLTTLTLTLTRAQFTTPLSTQTELTRLDLTPTQTYRIAKLDTHDPHHYVLTLSKVGP